MTGYAILLDGERVAHMSSDDAVSAWIAKYREDHAADDPSAVHLQILERGALAWLTGGKLVDRERFLQLKSVSWNEVRARRLMRGTITERASAEHLLEVVRETAGIHAQVMAAAELSIAERVEGLTQQDVRDASSR